MTSSISNGPKKWWAGCATTPASSAGWKNESRSSVREGHILSIPATMCVPITPTKLSAGHTTSSNRKVTLWCKHPDSRNAVILHHIYQYTYQEDISVERARQYLQLPQEAFIVTAFGEFRNCEEIRMVLGAFRSWNEKQKLLLAPRLYPFSRHNHYGGNFLKRWASKTGYYLLMSLLNRVMKLRAGANDELIDNCDLPYYMAASNVIFIQRKGQLNSVNIPLAFLFHKVVIGPDSGNIGELLRNTGNPVFRSDKKQDIIRALKEARHLSARGKGEANYAYAIRNMSINKVGKQYAELYEELADRHQFN